MRILIWLISLVAIGLALAIAFSGPGVRLGLWEYGTGLGLIRKLALPAMIAAGLSVLALLLSLWKARGLTLLSLIALASAGAAAMVPVKMRAAFEGNPFIHDITTDFENPPQIAAAADEPRKNPPQYLGDDPVPQAVDGVTVAEAQMRAFPDITSFVVAKDMDGAVAAARETIESMGMEIIAEGPVSEEAGSGWRIEAVDTTLWFGFKDDFVVRLASAEGGAATRVDVRSKSRVGGSDLGANAVRVRKFMEQMKS